MFPGLGCREWVDSLPFARTPSKLPVVLSGSEVERVLAAFDSPTHRAIATLRYDTYELDLPAATLRYVHTYQRTELRRHG